MLVNETVILSMPITLRLWYGVILGWLILGLGCIFSVYSVVCRWWLSCVICFRCSRSVGLFVDRQSSFEWLRTERCLTIFLEAKKKLTYIRARVTRYVRNQFSKHQIWAIQTTDGQDFIIKWVPLFPCAYFQGIKEILIVMSIKSCFLALLRRSLSEQGQFPVGSITRSCDIQYQGMLVWVQKIQHRAPQLSLFPGPFFFWKTDSALL